MMMKKAMRLAAFILTALMIFPLLNTAVYSAEVDEVSILRETFDRFSQQVGQRLDVSDSSFAYQLPSTTTVSNDGDNIYLKVDFASSGDVNKTVHYIRNQNGAFQLVDETTEGAITTDEASYGLISGQDDNLDKNIAVKHEQINSVDHPTVILETKYYLSADAKGRLQSQIRTYSSKQLADKNQTKANWLNLFNINADSGKLEALSGGTTTENLYLNKGDWTTVSLVIDMVNGKVDYYLDHALAVRGADLKNTELSFFTNSYICAKIPRTTKQSSNAKTDLAGYFAIDDVRICTPASSAVFSISNNDTEGLMYVELNKGNVTVENTHWAPQFLQTDGWTVKPVYFESTDYEDVVTSISQSEIRTDENGGIRFINSVDPEKYEALLSLKKSGAVKDVGFGTVIAPTMYVLEAGFFNIEALGRLGHSVNYLKVEGTDGAWYREDYTFAGSLKNILPSHYDADFTAIGYVSVTFKNGNVKYFYGDYAMRGGASIMELAESALQSDGLSNSDIEFLEQFKYISMDVGSDALIQNVMVVKNTLLFELYHDKTRSFDTRIALTYTGKDGWRVKAASAEALGVESFGAAQALATYMGEEPDHTALPLTVTLSDGQANICVRSVDGSFVNIAILQAFCMEFCTDDGTGEGKCVSSIRDVYLEDGDVTVIGGLTEPDEAVYGGGERFDTTNKVDTGWMDLYTADRWNNSSSTYMAIPFFVTTAGAGIYINRYERMKVRFDGGANSSWTVQLENEVMDCYIFAGGDMKEVYKGYTALTGNADIPSEWAYGVMLCRYSTDFQTFDKDKLDENGNPVLNRDKAPSGRSVKTLVTNMIAAGMKPSAVVMEPWNYRTVSTNADALRELTDTVNWLDEQGIKTMLYMRVGGTFDFSAMKGFQYEYLLHAYVNGNYTTDIPDVNYNGGNPDVSKNVHSYLDITNPQAVTWFFDEIWGQLIDIGIDGVKIDFCEQMPDEFYDYGSTVVDYDWYDSSKIVSGTEHHAYPVYFISAFYKRMNELKDTTGDTSGFYVLSRGGGIGSQRNPYLWAGDQVRSFDKLDDALLAVVNSGLSGVPFMTYDMAGYRYPGQNYNNHSKETESKIFSRAVEFSAFTTNIQTHGTVRNAYELTEQAQQIYRNFTGLHEDLYPYINQYVKIACETGIPVVRHLVLNYQSDKNVRSINDEFMLGEGLLIAPIFNEATVRQVYLPEGSWMDLLTGEIINVGTDGKTVTVHAEMDQIPVFLNMNDKNTDSLLKVFNGEHWQAVNRGTVLGNRKYDPYEEDIF